MKASRPISGADLEKASSLAGATSSCIRFSVEFEALSIGGHDEVKAKNERGQDKRGQDERTPGPARLALYEFAVSFGAGSTRVSLVDGTPAFNSPSR
jgi:hypothetical protein